MKQGREDCAVRCPAGHPTGDEIAGNRQDG